MEKLLTAEKTFVRMFMEHKKFYVDSLSEEDQLMLNAFVTRFYDIYWFHSQLLEEMQECGNDVEKVSGLFKTHLKVRDSGLGVDVKLD